MGGSTMTVEQVANSTVKYITELFEVDKQEYLQHILDLELCEEEEELSQEDKELLERHRISEDPMLPEWMREAVLIGCVYDWRERQWGIGNVPKVVEEGESRLKIKYDLLTEWVLKRFCVVTFNQILFIYSHQMYVENKGEIEKEITNILKKNGISDERQIRGIVNEVVTRVMYLSSQREYPFNKLGAEFIPLKNGILWRGKEYRLLPHSPCFLYTYRLPVKFDPNAECPKIDKFLSEIVEPDNVDILYEIPASCLLQSSEYHEAYMLVGGGGNGKSTFLKLVEALLGKENVSSVSLQELCESRFKVAALVGKLANIYADIPRKPVKYFEKFKMITGGDGVTVERKYKDPFKFRNTARLIFAANELPTVTEDTYAFWRRWILIEFPNTFPPNPNLIKELTTDEELSGFLNKVLAALTKIEIQGRLSKSGTVEKLMETWKKMSNPVYAFVLERCEADPNAWETKDDVYADYVDFCKENDLRVLSKNVFAQELGKHIRVAATKKKVGGTRVWVWVGLKLKPKKEEDEEEKPEEMVLDFFNEGEE
ncbi:MAG: DNA primase family protein [Methermicoccaceae archaeon]